MPVDHYENFPVASILCPPRLRAPIEAIYAFARTADDLADEGEVAPDERLSGLAAYRLDLVAVAAGRDASLRWRTVFAPLALAIERHALPVPLLLDLLDAFVQDVSVSRYADRPTLLDYCRRSANPVGRLLLHLYGIASAEALERSDAICTALQLANFWQDLGRDTAAGRLYLPESDCHRRGVNPADILAGQDGPAVQALIGDVVVWARDLMHSGAPLVHQVPGRAGWELRLVVQGGLRVLERIDRLGGATLAQRPVLGWADALPIAWRSLRMSKRRPMSQGREFTAAASGMASREESPPR